MSKPFLTLAILAAVLSCSVKEERDGCLCTLMIDTAMALEGYPESEMLLSVRSGESVSERKLNTGSAGRIQTFQARKGDAVVFSAIGLRDNSTTGGTVRIKEGRQADSVFAYAHRIDIQGEWMTDTVRLAKQFSSVEIQLSGDPCDGSISVGLEGNVCGFQTTDLSPVQGPFKCALENFIPSIYRGRIPRQSDQSLRMTIFVNDGKLREIEIGKLITKAGMDWSKIVLEDISILVDISTTFVSVSIGDWEKGVETEREI